MENQIIQIISYNLLAVLIPALVALAVEYLRRKLGVEKLKQIQEELAAKQELALLAVRFVEQVYVDLRGPAKYQAAAEWMEARARERGLKLTADEVKGLVEAALRQLKDSFGAEWSNAASRR
ncbi:MAG: phage holin [Bacillota bacterium]|jgi:LL-H family phage holin